MAFGEPRIDRMDDGNAALSSIRGRVRILAERLRMHLTEEDVAELIGIIDDCDRAQTYWLDARAVLSSDYLRKIGRQ
jgi:hypothetical protein